MAQNGTDTSILTESSESPNQEVYMQALDLAKAGMANWYSEFEAQRVNALVPTLETGPIYQEKWFTQEAVDNLCKMYDQIAHLNGGVVQVGIWEGISVIGLAQHTYPLTVCAVDTWEGSKDEGDDHVTVAPIRAGRNVYERFLQNTKVCANANIRDYKMDWREFVCVAEDAPHFIGFRFVFLDHGHTYEETRAAIEAFVPLLVPGGMICGDDYGHIPVGDAVRDTLPDHRIEGFWAWNKPL